MEEITSRGQLAYMYLNLPQFPYLGFPNPEASPQECLTSIDPRGETAEILRPLDHSLECNFRA